MTRDPLLAAILAALTTSCSEPDPAPPEPTKDTGCMSVAASVTECPPAEQVALEDLFLDWNCDEQIIAKYGEGTRTELTGQTGVPFAACCYDVDKIDPDPLVECVVGRPFKEAGSVRAAPIQLRGSETARAWARAAEAEHASVAAFARLSLQLMAWGAPLDLLEGTHRAALDEVRHVQACLDMARRCGATDVSLDRFPFTRSVEVTVSLAALATETLLEGCINETLGAYLVREAARQCSDPEARATLQILAEDEARHAALAYRVVHWALEVGGASVRAALVAALGSRRTPLDIGELAMRTSIPAKDLSTLLAEGMRHVVGPALDALLAA